VYFGRIHNPKQKKLYVGYCETFFNHGQSVTTDELVENPQSGLANPAE
jgi:hypothetical protein